MPHILHTACKRKKQYILPDELSRSETLNNLAHNNFIREKLINEISKADCFTLQLLF